MIFKATVQTIKASHKQEEIENLEGLLLVRNELINKLTAHRTAGLALLKN